MDEAEVEADDQPRESKVSSNNDSGKDANPNTAAGAAAPVKSAMRRSDAETEGGDDVASSGGDGGGGAETKQILPPGPKAKAKEPPTSKVREGISKLLLAHLDEDSKEFTELDIKEMMPTSPFSDNSFAKLKEFFESVIHDLHTASKVGIPLDEVKEEFFFIWDGIQKSHDNLNGLLNKDVALTADVADTMAKTRNLIRIAEDNPEITARLGSRLETAWNLVDVSEEEEKRNAARIEELRTDIMILNRNIQAAAVMEGQTELTELMKIRRKLQDERDNLNKDLSRMKTSLALLQERKNRLGEKRIEYQEAIRYADEEAAAQTEALRRESARKEQIEKEIDRLTEAIETKSHELSETEKSAQSAKTKLAELERGVQSQKVMNEGALKDAETAFTKLEKAKHDFDAQVDVVEKLAMDTYKKQNDLREKEDEIVRIKAEGQQAVRQRNTNLKRCAILQERLVQLENDREALKQKIINLEKELEEAQKKLEQNRRKVEELDKKRTVVNRNLTRAAALASEHENQLKVHLVASNNLEREMEAYKKEITSQTQTIHRLERERDFYAHEATKLAHEFAARLDEVKKMDTIVFEFNKKIGELEGTIKSKHQEYEQSLVEKRFFEKLLRDCGSAITETQREVRHKTFELNMEIYAYYDEQNRYSKQKALLDHLLREGTFFKTEADRIRKMAIDMQREVEALESERSLLGCGVAEAENELSKQRYYAMQAESRRSNYNRRLHQREAELQQVWETWRTLHSMVRIGAYHFRFLMAEIRNARQNIVQLRGLQHKFKGQVNNIVTLQQEISILENCIAKETCMVNALEEELSRPINVHRWRALEAIDPDAYDTIKKINIVTKRLVDQNESIRKQSIRITDKERIYVDLRHVIRRLPSIETPELIQYYEVLLTAKREQLKKIKMDLYTMESQTSYFRNEVSKINDSLKKMKFEYFRQMRSGGLKNKKKSVILPDLSGGSAAGGMGLRKSVKAEDILTGTHALTAYTEGMKNFRTSAEKAQTPESKMEHDMGIDVIKGMYTDFEKEQEQIEKDLEARKSKFVELAGDEVKSLKKSQHELKLAFL